MIDRILKARLTSSKKSVLLLGPRQVGKSTLCLSLSPQLTINLAFEDEFQNHLKDPGLLRRVVGVLDQTQQQLILIDEVQRIPTLLNSLQALIDEHPNLKFMITGSSARKLKRGKANLLPGRVLIEQLPPLTYWEIQANFNLQRALNLGSLPEIYLNQDHDEELLKSYVLGYLREEIQAEALTKDLGAYSRFLDMAAESSGQYINYSKVASDSEINKETIRRYMEILSDTLLIEYIPSYTKVNHLRRARQKDKFIFFDLGVRNAICNTLTTKRSNEQWGFLFEQWIILQVLYFQRLFQKSWRIFTYRDAGNVEVDLIIEDSDTLYLVEIKFADTPRERMFANLMQFSSLVKAQKVVRLVIYCGTSIQKFDNLGHAIPYQHFLNSLENLSFG